MVKHLAYGGDVLDTIGTVVEAKEDEYGAWFHAPLSSVDIAQRARTLVLEGHVRTCSVGYLPVKWNWLTMDEYVDGMDEDAKAAAHSMDSEAKILEHTEIKWLETTLTVIPMNELAVLTAAKSLDFAASRVKDIALALEPYLDAEPLNEERSAGILKDVFGTEAEAKAFRASIQSIGKLDKLAALVDKLLAPVPRGFTGKTAEARQRDVNTRKRFVESLKAQIERG
jgi:hypothetical protein